MEQSVASSAIVISPIIKSGEAEQGSYQISHEDHLTEAVRLAESIGLDVLMAEIIYVARVKPSTLIGEGVLERLEKFLEDTEHDYLENLPAEDKRWGAPDKAYRAPVLIMDCSLSPAQQRNLEQRLKIKVIDRTGLILDIFGARARSFEGKLQVELASLDFQRSRLVRSWTHLERQRGGFGFLGGPGERQIELDRRIISDRIRSIKKSLDKVRNGRALQRRTREKSRVPIVALVGYTNAGKSTLFRCLTKSDTYVADRLFATLDSFMRPVKLLDGQEVLLVDTVGFISDLPTELIAAFRATLEEAEMADLLLHVCDSSSDYVLEQKGEVDSILDGLDLREGQKRLVVLNKVDLGVKVSEVDDDFVQVSAVSGEGRDELLRMIGGLVMPERRGYRLRVGFKDGELQAWLYEHGEVSGVSDVEGADSFCYDILLDDEKLSLLRSKFGDLQIESFVS